MESRLPLVKIVVCASVVIFTLFTARDIFYLYFYRGTPARCRLKSAVT